MSEHNALPGGIGWGVMWRDDSMKLSIFQDDAVMEVSWHRAVALATALLNAYQNKAEDLDDVDQ